MRLLLVLTLLLAGCAPWGDLILAPEVGPGGETVEVYVATTRRILVDRDPAEFRAEHTAFLRRTVSVPPERAPGSVSPPSPPVDPATEFFATDARQYPGAESFRRDLRTALRARPRTDREVVVYVHGFNNSFADGVLRIAQLSHDLGFPGVAVHYSWPSAANPLGYGYDHDSVLYSRDGLEELLRLVTSAGAERVLIVAHSMGGLLTMEALRQIAIADPGWPRREIDGVVLISPDIDIEVFQSQARGIGDLPERFAIFVSERDRVLRLSSGRTGLVPGTVLTVQNATRILIPGP